MPRPIVIADVETTGLDPARHEIWEVALIERATGAAWTYLMEPDLRAAETEALAVGRFAERTGALRPATLGDLRRRGPVRRRGGRVPDLWNATWGGDDSRFWSDPVDVAAVLSRVLQGATLVAANPAFDAGFIGAFLNRLGHPAQPWHYRLRDIGSMAYGWLAAQQHLGLYFGEIPAVDASTDELARAVGVNPAAFDRHTALGDCLLVDAMLDRIEGAA